MCPEHLSTHNDVDVTQDSSLALFVQFLQQLVAVRVLVRFVITVVVFCLHVCPLGGVLTARPLQLLVDNTHTHTRLLARDIKDIDKDRGAPGRGKTGLTGSIMGEVNW